MTYWQSEGDDTYETNDLESLLQQHFDDEELTVKNFKSWSLLPPGENFASIMVKLDVEIGKTNELENTELHLVKKSGIVQGDFLPILSTLFEKEVFVYAELMSVYRDIEKEAGVGENDLIDVLPKFFGYRNYLDSDATKHLGIYFLMENLKETGYNTLDRRLGIDVHRSKIALASLGRYHALGVAMLQKPSTFTAEAMRYARMSFHNVDFLETSFKVVRRAFDESPNLWRYIPKLETSMESCKKLAPPEQPWVTITHGDFWTNNILFSGDCVKFIDFQLYAYDSPLRDVLYFLCCSLDDDAAKYHVDALLEVYRRNFSETLKKVGCDDSVYGDFEVEMKRLAIEDFARFALALKFIVFEARNEDEDDKEMYKNVVDGEISDVYKNRLVRLVDFYEARKWFS